MLHVDMLPGMICTFCDLHCFCADKTVIQSMYFTQSKLQVLDTIHILLVKLHYSNSEQHNISLSILFSRSWILKLNLKCDKCIKVPILPVSQTHLTSMYFVVLIPQFNFGDTVFLCFAKISSFIYQNIIKNETYQFSIVFISDFGGQKWEEFLQ